MQMFIHKKKSDESFGILALYVTCRCAAYSEQKRNRRRSRTEWAAFASMSYGDSERGWNSSESAVFTR